MTRPQTLTALAMTIASLALGGRAEAQQPRRIPIAAVDVRAFYSSFGRDEITAEDLGVASTDLPSRAPGVVAGLQVYPLRFSKLAFGVGGEVVIAGASATQDVESGEAGGTAPVTVQQHLRGMSGQVSLNFGHETGWSYLSAGMGPLAFYSYTGDLRPAEAPAVDMTINLGGGARWFMKRHVAFSFDVRFYQTRPAAQTPAYPRRQRNQLLVMSAGLSYK
jgi:hypothetical protein